ncbi:MULTISPECIES: phosphatase PAP2 family protein [unclassified Micromonospora]|uniref:phosphatase PAP2 family protein n=1 Tax=unclassified Micromonospora TaxID=2617518 RepID=UPI0033A7FA57
MNYHLFHLINAAAGHNDPLDDVLEWCAVWLIYLLGALAAVTVLLGLKSGGGSVVVRVGASLALAFAAGQVVAVASTEVRPFQTHPVHQLIPHDPGGSLPSDHATAAFAVAFAVGVFLSWRWGLLLSALATVIGFARVWSGVHYPADILAGAVIGAGAVLIIALAVRVLDRRAHQDRPRAAASRR